MVNNELKTLFIQYKNDTIELTNSLETEKFDLLEKLINRMQEIIDLIDKTEYTVKELAFFYNELEIKLYQDKLEQVILLKRDIAKNELKIISKSIKANSQYNKKVYENTRVFSKKI